MAETSMLIYPWDVRDDGVDQVVGTVAGLGVSRLVVATAYHSAEVISPRRISGVVTVAEPNTTHLALPGDAFSGLAVPPSSIARNEPDLYQRLKVAADAAGIRVDGWGIGLHNTTLATDHPDLAIQNCFGDAFAHGLCPANPTARRYALELFTAIAATGLFDRVLAESVSYLLYSHGHPHELWGARLDASTRYLLSLCFCEHCLAAAGQRGVDGAALRETVTRELHRTWNAPFPAGRDPDGGNELASLHQVWPELAAYTRMRMNVVTSVVQEIADAVRARGAAFDASAAVWGRPIQTNWVEGVDVAATLQAADGFVLESYYETAGEVAREIDHTQAIAAVTNGSTGRLAASPEASGSAAALAVALTLWPMHHGTVDGFLAKVRTVRDAGVERLALYNYGTATVQSLSWAAEAARVMTEARQP